MQRPTNRRSEKVWSPVPFEDISFLDTHEPLEIASRCDPDDAPIEKIKDETKIVTAGATGSVSFWHHDTSAPVVVL
jgi:hypothetical protein